MEEEIKRATAKAERFLESRSHSEEELRRKLRRTFSAEVTAEAIEQMRLLGYINDLAYAENVAHYYIITKNNGAGKAKFELMKRGLSSEITALALHPYKDIDQTETITGIIEAKFALRLNGAENFADKKKEEARVFRSLIAKGFAYDDIKKCLKDFQK